MNKKITIFKLIEFIKYDKVPRQIKYDGIIWKWNKETKLYECLINGTFNSLFSKYKLSSILNDKVEILDEENDEFEDIEEIEITKDSNCKRYMEYEDKTGHHKYTIRVVDEFILNKINTLNKNQKKLIERLNKDE